jgi:hypothetical protein
MPTLTRFAVKSENENDDTLPPLPDLPTLSDEADDAPPNPKPLKRKYRSLEKIDLSDVPPQPLILKNSLPGVYTDNSRRRPVKEGKSSKYQGVYFDSKMNKWKAQMMIEGTVRALGYFKEEQDAAANYAKAAFKVRDLALSNALGS